MRRRDRFKEAIKGPFKAHTNKASVAVPPAPPSPSVTVPGSPASLAQSQLQHPTGNLWSQALNKLSAEDKALLPQINPGSNLDILRHLRAIAQQRQEECDEKRWKFELFGQQIILRDVAEKVIVWVDRFKEIGDVAVNFDPVHAALPWAGIRFLLEVSIFKLVSHIL